jgi:hypothetical protein
VGIANGQRVACQCFGNDGETIGLGHLLRNGLLALAAAVGTLVETDHELPKSGRDFVVVAAGLVAGWLCTRWDDVSFLLSAVFGDTVLSPRASR